MQNDQFWDQIYNVDAYMDRTNKSKKKQQNQQILQ